MSRTFASIRPPLAPESLRAVASLGFSKCTPVQQAAIPLFLKKKDVVAEAVTGSGKTLAFLLPALELVLAAARKAQQDGGSMPRNRVLALIVSPTRELAAQTHKVLNDVLPFYSTGDERSDDIRSALLVGGTDVEASMEQCVCVGCHVVVCTPGRVLDMLDRVTKSLDGIEPEKPVLDVSALRVLVMDEADMLLELGFERAMGRLLERLPKSRVTALFSATQTKEVRALAMAGMLDPVAVRVRVAASRSAGKAAADGVGGQAAEGAAEGAGSGASENLIASMPQQSLRLPARLSCFSVRCPAAAKMGSLVMLLRACAGRAAGGPGTGEAPKLIVFALTCGSVEYMARVLAVPVFARDPAATAAALARGQASKDDDGAATGGSHAATGSHAAEKAWQASSLQRTVAEWALSVPRRAAVHWRDGGAGAAGAPISATVGVAPSSSSSSAPSSSPSCSSSSSSSRSSAPSRAASRQHELLEMAGLPAEPWRRFPLLALHGRMPQKKRRAVLEAFRQAPAGVLVCTDVAARGLDVPDVDCVVQLDAPKEVDTYVHRVGRAARAGRAGSACILLSPQERDFEELLQLKGLPVQRREHLDPADMAPAVLPSQGPEVVREAADASALAWRRLAASDRAILEAGSNAVLAHLRGYSEHVQKLALPFHRLDIAGISRSWGLLKAPNVKEARGMPAGQKEWWADPEEVDLPASAEKAERNAGQEDRGKGKGKKGRSKKGMSKKGPGRPTYRWPVPDTSVVRFLDPEREAARKLRLQKEQARQAEVAARLGVHLSGEEGAHSAQLPKMAGKGERAMEHAAKQAALRARAEQEQEAREGGKAGRKRKGQQQRLFEEWDELADESRLLRKLKRGEITDEQYDEMTGGGGLGGGPSEGLDGADTPAAKRRRTEDEVDRTSAGAVVAASSVAGNRAALLAAVKATVLGGGRKRGGGSSGQGAEQSSGAGQLVRRLHEEHRRQRRHASKSTKKVRAVRQQKRKNQAAGGGGGGNGGGKGKKGRGRK